jgi:hypothetical protein
LQALTEVVGVTVVFLVNVPPKVITLVVVAKLSFNWVLVGVGRVTVLVKRPEKTVAGGSVEVTVAERRIVSVVVVAGAKMVVVVLTGTSPVTVMMGASGARRSKGAAASRAFSLRLRLAASIRARAHSISTARSALRIKRCSLGIVVGVTSAAGCRSVGEYLQGLSGWPGRPGVVQVAVMVWVVTPNTFVNDNEVFVMTLVDVVVVGGGVTVLVFFAVPLGNVTVESGPVVMTLVNVVVVTSVLMGVEVILKVTVGVNVVVVGVPTVR